jgi:carbamoyltransferase
MLRIGRDVHGKTGMKHLVLRRGRPELRCQRAVAARGPYDDIWIQPAAGVPAAPSALRSSTWHQLLDKPRSPDGRDAQKGSFLRASLRARAHSALPRRTRCAVHIVRRRASAEPAVARLLMQEKVIGWFQGRMEFGPEPWARSIIGDPLRHDASHDEPEVKFRESFRPFAPIVLKNVHEWFDMRPGQDSPYMLLVAPVREAAPHQDRARRPREDEERSRSAAPPDVLRSSVPAVTHVITAHGCKPWMRATPGVAPDDAYLLPNDRVPRARQYQLQRTR